jgi:phage tail-like protein
MTNAEGWVPLGVADRRPARPTWPLPGASASARPKTRWPPPASPPPRRRPACDPRIPAHRPPGRYLWLRVRLAGTRRQGPSLFALRATFPRPSLLDYLPAYWRSDPAGADATERALALFEGWTTEMDQRIDVLPQLIDPRRVPAEALPWLGSFLALSFDTRVREGVRRELLLHMAELYRARGTVPGLARLLSILAEAPVQIIEGFRLRRPTAAFLGSALIGPALELGGSESTLDAAGLEDWEQELAGAHAALMLRRATQDSPCPARDPDDPLPDDALLAFYRRHAHRFTVIVPRARCSTLAAVLELAIETSKPAHTLHRLCWLDAGFRVGSASLVGVSHLGPVDKAEPAVLGSAVLSTFTTLHRGRREDRYPYFKPMNPWEASP